MTIILLAVTQPKMSYQDEKMVWYKEYGVLQFENGKERGDFYAKHKIQDVLNYLNPCVSFRRRVDVVDGTSTYHDYQYLTVEKDIYTAACNVGDSDYYSAKSCNRVHEQVLAYNKKYDSLQKELTELNNKIEPNKYQSKNNLQKEYNELFESNLKKNSVYTAYLGKNQPGTPKQNKIDAIRKTVRLQYDVELARITTRIDIIRKELSEMKVEDF